MPFRALIIVVIVLVHTRVSESAFQATSGNGRTVPLRLFAKMCPEIPLTPRPGKEIAVLASGWFWGPQPAFRALYGVDRCIVGYSGGLEVDPTYSQIKDHTESYLVEFDKQLISFESIVMKWKAISTPYPAERQYRTAIFYTNPEQEAIARAVAKDIDHVDVEPFTRFYMAEERHQNFLNRL